MKFTCLCKRTGLILMTRQHTRPSVDHSGDSSTLTSRPTLLQCPLIVPIYVMTAILSDEGDIITTSEFHIMWTGDFTDEERAFLPPLGPAQGFPMPCWRFGCLLFVLI